MGWKIRLHENAAVGHNFIKTGFSLSDLKREGKDMFLCTELLFLKIAPFKVKMMHKFAVQVIFMKRDRYIVEVLSFDLPILLLFTDVCTLKRLEI